MRKALIVGIDYYESFSSLHGCVNDAKAVANVLEYHGDLGRTGNFIKPKVLLARDKSTAITRGQLKDAVSELFRDKCDLALFYYAGHGSLDETGGYLCTSECRRSDDGLSLAEVLLKANGPTNRSPSAANRIVVLDSCHSGIAGDPPGGDLSVLKEGTTVLAASTEKQYASEADGRGLYTSLLVDALQGAASNLVGDITPGSIYAHIDQGLGPWEQRPVFKTNIQTFMSLRQIAPIIPRPELRMISEYFPEPGFLFQLDPSFEPRPEGKPAKAPKPNKKNTETFGILQKYNRNGLLVPVGASKPHMWHAAIESKGCKLTPLGEHYRRLAAEGKIK